MAVDAEAAARTPAFSLALVAAGALLLAASVRVVLAAAIQTPWIMVDELIYSELAKSFAATGSFRIRDEPAPFVSVYPALISPAWLADTMATTYATAKAINALLMTLAVVPVYLWGRRLVSRGWALVATALVLLMPAFLYTGTLMTENAFLPAFLTAAFALALALERPTVARQAVALGAIALASAVRLQGLVLLLVLPTAVVVEALLARPGGQSERRARVVVSRLRAFAPSFALVGLAGAAYLVAVAVRGGGLGAGLGAYRAVGDAAAYDATEIARWLALHAGELALSVALVPVSALVVLLGLSARRPASDGERAFLAVSAASVFWILLQVAAFASRFSDRIEERNMVYVVPLLLLALVVWLGHGLPRPPLLVVAATVVPGALAAAVPLAGVLDTPILSDTFSLVPLVRLADAAGLDAVRIVVGAAAVVAALAFSLLHRRAAVAVLPALVAAVFVVSSYTASVSIRDYSRAVARAAGGGDLTWLDQTLGERGQALYLHAGGPPGNAEALNLWQGEFWNRTLGPVVRVRRSEPGGLPAEEAEIDAATGAVAAPAAAGSSYVVSSPNVEVAGTLVADRFPFVVYRAAGPLRVVSVLEGVYSDGWMGRSATYTRYGARGDRAGTMGVFVSRAGWPGVAQSATIAVEVRGRSGRVASREQFVIRGGADRLLRLPTPRPPFAVRVRVEPTASGASGGSDPRELGARVTFRFLPARR